MIMRYIRCISIGIGFLILCNFCYSTAQKTYKIVFIGDTKVGKTSIISQLFKQGFKEEIITSIQGDKQYYDYIGKDGVAYKFEIWDSPGQETFQSANKIFCKKANGIVAVYDITAEKSLNALEERIKLVLEVNPGKNLGDDIHMIICANKSDLYEQAKINGEDGRQVAENYNVKFFETSAKEYDGVYKAVSDLFDQIIEKEKSKNLKNPVSEKENPIIENEKPSITDQLIPGQVIIPNLENELPRMNPNLRRKNNIEKSPKQDKKRCRCPCSKGKQDGDILDMM
jgi:small GTP-binding protein